MKMLCLIAAISALIWALVVVVVLARDSQPEDMIVYVSAMTPTGRDEMCEVWTQDRWSVIQSLRSLGGASVEEAARIAGAACGRA